MKSTAVCPISEGIQTIFEKKDKEKREKGTDRWRAELEKYEGMKEKLVKTGRKLKHDV